MPDSTRDRVRRLLTEGRTVAEIAAEVGVTANQVRFYVREKRRQDVLRQMASEELS